MPDTVEMAYTEESRTIGNDCNLSNPNRCDWRKLATAVSEQQSCGDFHRTNQLRFCLARKSQTQLGANWPEVHFKFDKMEAPTRIWTKISPQLVEF
ncbi:MAG: hypothetical protein AB3N20_14515 [Rhizobiaceae bacterium]